MSEDLNKEDVESAKFRLNVEIDGGLVRALMSQQGLETMAHAMVKAGKHKDEGKLLLVFQYTGQIWASSLPYDFGDGRTFRYEHQGLGSSFDDVIISEETRNGVLEVVRYLPMGGQLYMSEDTTDYGMDGELLAHMLLVKP